MPDGFPLVLVDGRTLSAATTIATIAHLPQVLPPALRPHTRLLTDEPSLASTTGNLSQIALADLATMLAQTNPPWVGYLPLADCRPPESPETARLLPVPHPWDAAAIASPFIAPWLPMPSFPAETALASPSAATAWITTPALLSALLPSLGVLAPWKLLTLAQHLEALSCPFQWRVVSTPASLQSPVPSAIGTVLAVVPHYRCEPWLQRCLSSLLSQTRPPEAIVVVDDASPVPPIAIVANFPTVTLLTAPERVGPYRLVQSVIDTTSFDFYLFQDADDWSSGDRLARLLDTIDRTQADLVGTQEIRVEAASDTLQPVHYPLDVNDALVEKPGHPLLHPTSLVRRRLLAAVGGFATGLRYGGDTEFLLRAALVGRIVNLPDYGYFRQKRPDSLTTNPTTGLESRDRQVLLSRLKSRALSNRAALRSGYPPNLAPLALAPALSLRHCAGPPLS